MKPRVIVAITMITALLALIIASSGQGEHGVPSGDTDPGTPPQQPKPKPTGTLSDLRVDHVWLDDQCRINFKLLNAGEHAIPDKEHSQGMVRVYVKKSYEDFYFN